MTDPVSGLDDLVGRMRAELTDLSNRGDARRFFHATYLRTTEAVAEEIGRGGFRDADWLQRWDVAFAELYLDALAADRRDEAVSGPWRVAFGAARHQPAAPPLRHVLLGLNAHINYDLPQALLAVIPPGDFDDTEVLASRQQDHQHIDTVLQSRVSAEDEELTAVSRIGALDRVLRPANRSASGRFLAEAREKVWRNTVVLDKARRRGESAYADSLSALELSCEGRVRDLARPGFVLLRLARRGFGVVLPGA